jgi:4-hydroxy-tetrahydrodipicolinate synthase
MFKGSMVALITPYQEGVVDEKALENLIQWHIAEGTQGIVVCGSTGEGALLTSQEQKLITEISLSISRGRIPIITNTSAISLEEALFLSEQAQKAGAQGLMLTPPPYLRPTQDSIYAFIKRVHDSTELPLILYNNPARCGVAITQDTVVRLANLPRVSAIKDSTGDLSRVPDLEGRVPASFTQLCGEDVLNAAFLAQGGQGWISVTANAAPRLCARLYQAWKESDLKTFAHLRTQLAPLHKALFVESNPSPVKYAVAQQGFCSDEVRFPLLKATSQARKIIDEALHHAGIIKEIPKVYHA